MRQYAKLSILAESLGYPSDGKRFGRALVEVGLREVTGQPSHDAQQRGIAKKKASRWQYDVEAVRVRIMGGYCPPDIADEAETIGMELTTVDRAFTSCTEGPELSTLGERWDDAMKRVTPRHVSRLNGVLRREGAPFRINKDCQVEFIQSREKDAVA